MHQLEAKIASPDFQCTPRAHEAPPAQANRKPCIRKIARPLRPFLYDARSMPARTRRRIRLPRRDLGICTSGGLDLLSLS